MLLCATLTRAHESGCFANLEANHIQTDSVAIISEEISDYGYYRLINYSDGTSMLIKDGVNVKPGAYAWVKFDTKYEKNNFTGELTDKPLPMKGYFEKEIVWTNLESKEEERYKYPIKITSSEIKDSDGNFIIFKNSVVSFFSSYGVICMVDATEELIDYVEDVYRNSRIYFSEENETLSSRDFKLFLMRKKLTYSIIGPNGNELEDMSYKKIKTLSGEEMQGKYYDESTSRMYYFDDIEKETPDGFYRINGAYFGDILQACTISGNDDTVFVKVLPSDTIARIVSSENVGEVYYSNGDYLKFSKLQNNRIYDCLIHRPDGILTIKLEDVVNYNGATEERPVSRYKYTSGKYNGLINISKCCKLRDKDVLGVTKIINPNNPDYDSFFDPKTNHELGYKKDQPNYLYDWTLQKYVTPGGEVKDFEREAREKIEKERQQLYQKYGKNYVDALFDEGKILVGTPEGLVKNHTQSTLINETQYSRTYKIKGWLNDWGASVDVNVKTGKVTAVRNRTL